MYLKSVYTQVLAALFAIAAIPACAQVTPQGTQGGFPLTIGAGVSDFATDWGSTRMVGITATVDWRIPIHAKMLHGLDIEVEGRELDWDKPSNIPQLRQETGLGGFKYAFYHRKRVSLYGKFLAGVGGVYFPPKGTYSHDTRTVIAPGGGVDFRIGHGVSVRADYEYQFWRQLFGAHDLNPNGVTVGAIYSFGSRRD